MLSRSGLTAYDNYILHTFRLSLSVPTDVDIDAISAIHSDARTYDSRPELATKSREEAAELAPHGKRTGGRSSWATTWCLSWMTPLLGSPVCAIARRPTKKYSTSTTVSRPNRKGKGLPRRPQLLRLPMHADGSHSSPSPPSSTPQRGIDCPDLEARTSLDPRRWNAG